MNASKLKRAYIEGFTLLENGVLSLSDSESGVHFVLLNRFCSYKENTKWGRFHCRANLAQNQTLRILAFATDGTSSQAEKLNSFFQDAAVSMKEKKEYFIQHGIQFLNHSDVLLYELVGEYLWIVLEVEGGGSGTLSELVLDSRGDNFMQTFPEIYQEEGAFFHRYMSIFSSVYQDVAAEISSLDKYLDIERTPAAVLTELAGWMGFDVEGAFLEEDKLRKLVRALYSLNRIKGTKEAIKRLIKLVFDEEAVIIERSRIESYIAKGSKRTYQRLYGSSNQEVTILINRPLNEKLQAQMLFLIRQFAPVRSQMKLLFVQDCDMLDTYCYLDYNASLAVITNGGLDIGSRLDGMAILQ